MDLIRVSPYGPAACEMPQIEAEHTSAPDHMPRFVQEKACIRRGVHTRPGLSYQVRAATVAVIVSGYANVDLLKNGLLWYIRAIQQRAGGAACSGIRGESQTQAAQPVPLA